MPWNPFTRKNKKPKITNNNAKSMAKASATAAIRQKYGSNQKSRVANYLKTPGSFAYTNEAAVEKQELYQEYYEKYKPIDDAVASAVQEVGSKKLAKDMKKFIDLLDIKIEEMKQTQVNQQKPNQQIGGDGEEMFLAPFIIIWYLIRAILFILWLLIEAGTYTGRAAYRGATNLISQQQPPPQPPQQPLPQNRGARVARLQQYQTE
jgi:hypothetical protein